jgi:hypothetical protein
MKFLSDFVIEADRFVFLALIYGKTLQFPVSCQDYNTLKVTLSKPQKSSTESPWYGHEVFTFSQKVSTFIIDTA